MGRLEIVNGGQGSHGGLAQEQDASLPHTQQKRQVSSGIFEYKEKGQNGQYPEVCLVPGKIKRILRSLRSFKGSQVNSQSTKMPIVLR